MIQDNGRGFEVATTIVPDALAVAIAGDEFNFSLRLCVLALNFYPKTESAKTEPGVGDNDRTLGRILPIRTVRL